MRSCRHIRCSCAGEQRPSAALLGATRHETCSEINQNSYQPDSCGFTMFFCKFFLVILWGQLVVSFTGSCDWLQISRKWYEWYCNCDSHNGLRNSYFLLITLKYWWPVLLPPQTSAVKNVNTVQIVTEVSWILTNCYRSLGNPNCYRSLVNRN
jgi:hypothetical protein